MARILLHLGTPKTATTSLQVLFFNYLHKQGRINYIGKRSDFASIKTESKQEQLYHHIYRKVIYPLRFGDNFDKNLVENKQRINSIIDEHKINVISDENIFFAFDNDIYGTQVFNLELTQRLQTLFAGHFVEALCVFRKQADYLYSWYVHHYPDKWHYIKNHGTIKKYYNDIKLRFDKRRSMLCYADIMQQYSKVFHRAHCLFFEELLQDKFSYYQKIGKLLRLKITSADIPKFKLNTQQKTKYGYITSRILLPDRVIRHGHAPQNNRFILRKITFFCLRGISRVFFRYNIFLTKQQKKNIYARLMALVDLPINSPYNPKLHPYFTKKQKRTIFELCRASNKKLATEGFCKEQDLKKYGYL